jgi:hypothetical protein
MTNSAARIVDARGRVLLEDGLGNPASRCEMTQCDEGSVGCRRLYYFVTSTRPPLVGPADNRAVVTMQALGLTCGVPSAIVAYRTS